MHRKGGWYGADNSARDGAGVAGILFHYVSLLGENVFFMRGTDGAEGKSGAQ